MGPEFGSGPSVNIRGRRGFDINSNTQGLTRAVVRTNAEAVAALSNGISSIMIDNTNGVGFNVNGSVALEFPSPDALRGTRFNFTDSAQDAEFKLVPKSSLSQLVGPAASNNFDSAPGTFLQDPGSVNAVDFPNHMLVLRNGDRVVSFTNGALGDVLQWAYERFNALSSRAPTSQPSSDAPSHAPSHTPSHQPSSDEPSHAPSRTPSHQPSSHAPSHTPSHQPSSVSPSHQPTDSRAPSTPIDTTTSPSAGTSKAPTYAQVVSGAPTSKAPTYAQVVSGAPASQNTNNNDSKNGNDKGEVVGIAFAVVALGCIIGCACKKCQGKKGSIKVTPEVINPVYDDPGTLVNCATDARPSSLQNDT